MKDTSLKQIICNTYLAVLFIVYPLFQHDHYYNMGENKYYFYLWSTIIFLVLLVIAILTDEDAYKKSKSKNGKKKNRNTKNTKMKAELTSGKLSFKEKVIKIKEMFMAWFGPKSIVEKFVWAYLVFAIISFIFGIDKYTGFWGVDGWHMGLLIQCLMIACFFAFAKVWKPNMLPVWFAMIGSSVVMILGIVMRFGIDPLGNYEGLEQRYINTFISTIGQTSWYSAYICTVIPAGIALFYVAENKKTRIVYGVYTTLAFLAMAIADSDSIFLGIAGMLMVLFWVAFTDEKYMVRFWEITTMLAGAYWFMSKVKVSFSTQYNKETDWTSAVLKIEKQFFIVFIISFVFGTLLLLLQKRGDLRSVYSYKNRISVIRNTIYILVLMVIVSIVGYIFLNTKGVFGVTEDMIPWSGNIWYFNGAWGNARGVSWKTCWQIFSDYDIARKFIGIGPDSLAVVTQMVDQYKNMIEGAFGDDQVLTCAHNEFYNHVVVYGLLGGGTYLGIYVSSIIRYLKMFTSKKIVLFGAVCVASYMGHNFFCYQTVICTPFIFVIMGLCESFLKNVNETD